MHNVHAFLPSLDIEIASININHQEWDDWTGTLLTFLFLPPPSLPPLPPPPSSPMLLAENSLSLTPLDTSEARGLDQKLGYNGGAVSRLFTAGWFHF